MTMMIIPAIDLIAGKVVRLVQGDPKQKTVYSNDPIMIAKRWQDFGADMIHIVDLDATLGLSNANNHSLIKKIASAIHIPIQVGGGLRDYETILDMAKSVSRLVVGTLAFQNMTILKKLLDVLGKERIVISVDHYDGYITTHGWQKKTENKLVDAINNFLQMGFTEFLLTNVNKDGVMQGPDIKYLEQACSIPKANIIASGGISNVQDVEKVRKFMPYGVILGKALYENKITIQEACKFR